MNILTRKNCMHVSVIFSLILIFSLVTNIQQAQAATQSAEKPLVGIVVSKLSEDYASITRPAGTWNGKTIAAKNAYSSTKNKRLKAELMYKQLGYQVEYVNDAQLQNATYLKKFDTIVFPFTVMMNWQQREAVKTYIKDGGGAIFAFGTARNDSASYPYKSTDLDLSPLIYKTGTWIYEWDNLSEAMQMPFINDVELRQYTIRSSGTHPIVQNTLKRTGKSMIQLKNDRPNLGEWIEVNGTYPSSKVTPILTYGNYGYSSSPKDVTSKTAGAYATEFGKGKAIWLGFQPFNFISVQNDSSVSWDYGDGPSAYQYYSGGEDLKVMMDEMVKWTSQPTAVSHKLDRKTDMTLSGVSAYPRASDYVVYATMQAKNNGNVISRGIMRTNILSPNGTVLKTYEKTVLGLVPGGVSYPEKMQFSLPKNLAAGDYRLQTKFLLGSKEDPNFAAAGQEVILRVAKAGQKATIITPAFKDVPNSHWAKADIMNLSAAGIINGYQGQIFKPDQNLTRLQAATLLVRALNLNTQNRPDPKLADVKKGQYGYDIIATVVDEKIFSGSNGYFKANNPITREQMAKVIVGSFHLTGNETKPFKDVQNDRWSKLYISTLVANDVTNVDTHFRPTAYTSRAQFAAFIRRAMFAL
ncbi:hypothetical protein JOC78_002212 [Bacillus ectoiniformans]|uniref:S-layer homology domain-containing protein n=1 Tax=Bacillus ectoiniformans TaxID=1494429 RepID=UPI00195E8B99|nr:S-layer homology domain-containing protein [Bacillus ectoiniformans]MBM7649259.1 hypothetical protein [Bacillus ectoiniformans]